MLTSTNSLFFLTLALHVFARLRCLHFQAFRPSIFCFAFFQFLFWSSFSFTHRQILKKLVRRVAWFVAGMMARQQLAIADIMVPWALLQQVLQVWQLEPLHLSQVERRASSTIVLAAHSMRRSSFDWLRILCQEILFQTKQVETKRAMMTLPYTNLPASIITDILRYLVCDEFMVLQYMNEVAVRVQAPRSIVCLQEGTRFQYRQVRDELRRRLRQESVLHNNIRGMVSDLMRRNLLLASHIHILRSRALRYM